MLVVDDEPSVRSTLCEILALEGYQVHGAGSGEEALEVYECLLPQVVLMDIRMPGLDGVEVFRRLRCLQRDVRVIFTSGYSEDHLKEAALKEGAIAFLTKPLDLPQLLDLVGEVSRVS